MKIHQILSILIILSVSSLLSISILDLPEQCESIPITKHEFRKKVFKLRKRIKTFPQSAHRKIWPLLYGSFQSPYEIKHYVESLDHAKILNCLYIEDTKDLNEIFYICSFIDETWYSWIRKNQDKMLFLAGAICVTTAIIMTSPTQQPAQLAPSSTQNPDIEWNSKKLIDTVFSISKTDDPYEQQDQIQEAAQKLCADISDPSNASANLIEAQSIISIYNDILTACAHNIDSGAGTSNLADAVRKARLDNN